MRHVVLRRSGLIVAWRWSSIVLLRRISWRGCLVILRRWDLVSWMRRSLRVSRVHRVLRHHLIAWRHRLARSHLIRVEVVSWPRRRHLVLNRRLRILKVCWNLWNH